MVLGEEALSTPSIVAHSAAAGKSSTTTATSVRKLMKTSHKTTKLKPGVGSVLSGAGAGLYPTLSSGSGGLLPSSRVIAPQFKAKSSNIRIADGTSAATTIGGAAAAGGGSGGALSAASIASRKMRWMSNMRSDPDFRDAFARNVHVVVRQPRKVTTPSSGTPDVDSQDEVDFYSAVCDTQLSVGASPCKSPQELMALLAANRSGVVGSGVRPHRLGSGGAAGFETTSASSGAGRRFSGGGGGVDLSGSSSSNKYNWFSNTNGNGGRRTPSATNGNYAGLADNCKVLVVAKPVESQLIGFNVVNSVDVDRPVSTLTAAPPSQSNERLSGVDSNTAQPHPEQPALFSEVAPPPPPLRTEQDLALNATEASSKRPVSWVESRFKHRFFGRSNVVSSAQTKTKTNAIPTIPWFGPKSGSPAGTKRSSFTFREIRQELQAVMRQNSRSRGVDTTTTSKSVKATSGLAAEIKSKTMKKANATASAASSMPLDAVCEDIAQ